jgi:hypothetical protein
MSLQEMPCFEGALFYKGCFKLMQDALNMNLFINSLDTYFIDPVDNWDQINKVFGIYGFSPTISQGTPSKDVEAGDGSRAPWSSPSGVVGCMVTIFNTFENLGLLINPEELRITYTANPNPEEQKRLQIWKGLFGQYNITKETETSMIVLAYTIASQHNSHSRVTYSPAQINMYSNPLVLFGINEQGPYGSNGYSVLAKVPWNTANTLLSQACSMLSTPWETSLVDIELVEPIYEERIYRFTVSESNLSAPDDAIAPAIDFAGAELLYHTQKIFRNPQLTIDDPDYVPDPEPGDWDEGEDGPWVPPGPDPVVVSTPDCFAEYGERPEETIAYDPVDDETFHCGLMEGVAIVADPDPEADPGDTVEIPALVDACPYRASCQSPSYLNPILIDFDSGKLALDLTGQPGESNMQAYANDHVKIYYRIVHT